MSLFRKPTENKAGIKFLVYGKTGSGKSLFGLSFPKSVAIDTENGLTFYEGTDRGKNLIGILNTQSHRDVENAFDEMEDIVEEQGVKTIVIDSITKIREHVIEVVTNIDEKRARRDGKIIEEANTSMRSWGRVKHNMQKLQNKMIDLTSKGVNVVYTSQSKDIKEKQGDQFVTVGQEMDAQKGTDYDFDVILYMFKEETANGTVFKARVEKDRSETFKVGTILENPSYENWKESIEGRKGKTLETSYTENVEADKQEYEEELDNESKTLEERAKEIVENISEDDLKNFKADLKKAKINKFTGLTKIQSENLSKIIDKYS